MAAQCGIFTIRRSIAILGRSMGQSYCMTVMSNCDERVGSNFLLGSDAKQDSLLGTTDVCYILYAQAACGFGSSFWGRGSHLTANTWSWHACYMNGFICWSRGRDRIWKVKVKVSYNQLRITFGASRYIDGIYGIMYDSWLNEISSSSSSSIPIPIPITISLTMYWYVLSQLPHVGWTSVWEINKREYETWEEWFEAFTIWLIGNSS
jgi:hypothetical protein